VRRFATALAVGASGLLFAGCGSASHRATSPLPTLTSSAPSVSALGDYGAQYLRIVGPVNDASQKAGATIKESDTPAQIAKKFEPLIVQVHRADSELLKGPWPEDAQKDVKDLVAANVAMVAAIRDTKANPSDYLAAVESAASKAVDDAGSVRVDLGLPPNRGSSVGPDT
jgi:hypothetical protein